MSTEDKRKRANSYLKYSNIAFQLAFLVLIAYYGGFYLDQYLGTSPIFIIALIIIVQVGFFYKLYKELFNPQK